MSRRRTERTTEQTPHEHHFDPISGWCDYRACPVRDDGRIVYLGTEKHPGPEYTSDQLAAFLDKGLHA